MVTYPNKHTIVKLSADYFLLCCIPQLSHTDIKFTVLDSYERYAFVSKLIVKIDTKNNTNFLELEISDSVFKELCR